MPYLALNVLTGVYATAYGICEAAAASDSVHAWQREQVARAGDDEAKRRGGQKSVLERQGLPTFDVCVEMQARGEWTVWEDVGVVVDELLLGRAPPRQVRPLDLAVSAQADCTSAVRSCCAAVLMQWMSVPGVAPCGTGTIVCFSVRRVSVC